jgi:hypothetical protein
MAMWHQLHFVIAISYPSYFLVEIKIPGVLKYTRKRHACMVRLGYLLGTIDIWHILMSCSRCSKMASFSQTQVDFIARWIQNSKCFMVIDSNPEKLSSNVSIVASCAKSKLVLSRILRKQEPSNGLLSLGIIGGFVLRSSAHCTVEKKAWLFISAAPARLPKRFCGFLISNLLIRCLHCVEIVLSGVSGNVTFENITLPNVASRLSPLKGVVP